MQAAPSVVVDTVELFDARSSKANMGKISFVRTIATIAGGFTAGILGLTGLRGLAFYVLIYVVTSGLLLLRMGNKVGKLVPNASPGWFLINGIGGEALAFVLYWTLMYAMVHLY